MLTITEDIVTPVVGANGGSLSAHLNNTLTAWDNFGGAAANFLNGIILNPGQFNCTVRIVTGNAPTATNGTTVTVNSNIVFIGNDPANGQKPDGLQEFVESAVFKISI